MLRRLFLLGVFSVIANSQTTRVPESMYGEDVWDSSRHIMGYWAGKAFLTFEWGYLLPITAFLVWMVGKAVYYLVRRASSEPSGRLLVFARDGCGGFRPLGQLMIQIVYLDVPIVVVMIFLQLTHEKKFYGTLAFATSLFIVVVLGQLFLPFVPLHDALERLKAEKLHSLEQFLTQAEVELLQPARRAVPIDVTPLMAAECVYRYTMQLSTWPYARKDALKAFTPFIAPLVTIVIRLLA